MGIIKADCILLFYSKTLGVSFDKTLTLGRQHLYASQQDIEYCKKKFNPASDDDKKEIIAGEYAEPLFGLLGARSVDSIDYSPYQQATMIHDLNYPVSTGWHNRFSCVVDSGTIEHIFNFPVAIKNCMEMLSPGGHFIGITPVNNQMGHGFYQFSPELYYRVFSEANGFRVKKMFISVLGSEEDWYEVIDPEMARSRVTLENKFPLMLMVVAEKRTSAPVFAAMPQQSDYSNAWNTFDSLKRKDVEQSGGRMKYLYRKFLPLGLRTWFRKIYNLFGSRKVETQELGAIDPKHFRKVKI
jgi:SAM-dependent methyltransferase